MSSTQSVEQIVVTGYGAVSPLGLTSDETWTRLCEGESNFSPIAELESFEFRVSSGATLDWKAVREMWQLIFSREKQLPKEKAVLPACLAAEEAISLAGLDPLQRSSAALVVSTTSAGWDSFSRRFKATSAAESDNGDAISQIFYSGVATELRRIFGVDSPAFTLSAACASGNMSLGFAADLLRWSGFETVIVGGVESLGCVGVGIFNSLRLLAPEPAKPFDAKRTGLVLGEGATFFVLEKKSHAEKRNARIFAELSGQGHTCDATHMTRSTPEELTRASVQALKVAGYKAEEVDFVNCHGTGTPTNDQNELTAMKRLFKPRATYPRFCAQKGSFGHLQGTSGLIEALVTIKSLESGILPPSVGHTLPSEGAENYFSSSLSAGLALNVGMTNSLGFGGVNSSLVLSSPQNKRNRPKEYPSVDVVVTGVRFLCPMGSDFGSLTQLLSDSYEDDASIPKERLPHDTVELMARKLDRISAIVRFVGLEALSRAGWNGNPGTSLLGVSLGSILGSYATTEQLLRVLNEKSIRAWDPYDSIKNTFNAASSFLAISAKAKGPNAMFAEGLPLSNASLMYAYQSILSGRADAMLCGAFEELTPFTQKILSNEGPQVESVAMLVLESRSHALARGASILASIKKTATTLTSKKSLACRLDKRLGSTAKLLEICSSLESSARISNGELPDRHDAGDARYVTCRVARSLELVFSTANEAEERSLEENYAA